MTADKSRYNDDMNTIIYDSLSGYSNSLILNLYTFSITSGYKFVKMHASRP